MQRWWIYQRERFPLLGHGILILAFSSSTVCFSRLLRDTAGFPDVKTLLVAFLTALLFFLQLRIADEFKDFEEDSRYRPYRPVPRGLVTLRELAFLGVAGAVIQFVLALWLAPVLIWLLAGVWLYLVLMSKEFFVADWLRHRHVLYMLSHMAIVPLIDFYVTACDWLADAGSFAQTSSRYGLFYFVLVSYFNGIVIEIGRKIRTPTDEEEGVITYSVLWGQRTAVFVWLFALFVTAGFAVLAALAIDFFLPVAIWLALLLGLAVIIAWGFLAKRRAEDQAHGKGKKIETLSGFWTLGMYLSIGVLPMLFRSVWGWGFPFSFRP